MIALVRLQSRAAENSKQLDMLTKDVSRLEKESDVVVTLVANSKYADRQWSELWKKFDTLDKDLNAKMERHRDRLDEVRDKMNKNK
jgi:predicted transcriptional regulator